MDILPYRFKKYKEYTEIIFNDNYYAKLLNVNPNVGKVICEIILSLVVSRTGKLYKIHTRQNKVITNRYINNLPNNNVDPLVEKWLLDGFKKYMTGETFELYNIVNSLDEFYIKMND